MATAELVDNEVDGTGGPEVDSKYRLIILAAKRSNNYNAALNRESKSIRRNTSRRASRWRK